MSRIVNIIRSSIGQKTIMAITGLLLGLFLFSHLLGNATAFWGRPAFDAYVARLHSLGPIIPVFETILLVVFLVHIIFGLALFVQNLKARPHRYEVTNSAGGRTLGSRTMPYTGSVILIFLLAHLRTFHFTESASVSSLVHDSFSQPMSAAFYLFCLTALGFHVGHGFWSIFQSLGLNPPAYDVFISRMALVISITITISFMMIPILVLFRPGFLL